jgi:hypothetical protein
MCEELSQVNVASRIFVISRRTTTTFATLAREGQWHWEAFITSKFSFSVIDHSKLIPHIARSGVVPRVLKDLRIAQPGGPLDWITERSLHASGCGKYHRTGPYVKRLNNGIAVNNGEARRVALTAEKILCWIKKWPQIGLPMWPPCKQ